MKSSVNSNILYVSKLTHNLFGKYNLQGRLDDLRCLPFFILGSGRNGSTLLSMILNNHSKIYIPPEQYALHYASIRFQLYGFLIWQDIVKIVIGEFADSKNNERWETDFNGLYNDVYDLPKKQRTFQKIIDEIIAKHAKQNQEEYEVWGDKSPSTIWFLKYIYRVYPKSKYIFLIRDGRDVASSYQKGGWEIFGDLSIIENAAHNWKKSIDMWKWMKGKANSEQLLEIRYEQLVNQPEKTIREICIFLGYSFEEGMLKIDDIVRKRKETKRPHYKSLFYPINNEFIGNWKEKLTKEQLSAIMPIIKKGLQEYHYL